MPQYKVTMTRELSLHMWADSARQAEDSARDQLDRGAHPEDCWLLTISADLDDGRVWPEPPRAEPF
jgi:hypothetical protein